VTVVLPSDADPVVRGVTTAVGGPPGRHALLAEHRFWTPLRWLVLITLVTSLLGWWQKSPCRVQAWEEQYQYTRGCYTDVFALYFAERLDQGRLPYLEHPVEYPVVIGGVMTVAASVVSVLPADIRPRHFYDVDLGAAHRLRAGRGGHLGQAGRSTAVGRRDVRRRPAAGAARHDRTGTWSRWRWPGPDCCLWARRRPLAAGVLLGLATATKLYPVLFLVPLLALCVRARELPPSPVPPSRAGHAGAGEPAGLPGQPGLRGRGRGADRDRRLAAGPPGDEGLAALAPHRTVTGDDGAP
jgi:hypothetical protein